MSFSALVPISLVVFLVVLNATDKPVLSAIIIGWPLFVGTYLRVWSNSGHSTRLPAQQRATREGALSRAEVSCAGSTPAQQAITAPDSELPKRLARIIHWCRICIVERHDPGASGPIDEEAYQADIRETVGDVRMLKADEAGLTAVFQTASGSLEVATLGAIGDRWRNLELRRSDRLVLKLVPLDNDAVDVRTFFDGPWVDDVKEIERRFERLLRLRIDRAQQKQRQAQDVELGDALGEAT